MTKIESIHGEGVIGTLTTFDRMIFKGHLTGLYPDGAFQRFLNTQGVLLKGYAGYVKGVSDQLKAHAKAMAAAAGRPYLYAEHAMTKRSGHSKGDLAEEITARDGLSEGLVCVLSAVEPCSSFDVVGNRETHRLEIRRRRRKCLYLYYYFLDRSLGLIHVRLQTWFPFEIQVYMNGREILAKQLTRRGIGFGRYANAFTAITDCATAQRLADRLARRRWHLVLRDLAAWVNPFLPTIEAAGFASYWWVLDQAEVATDVMFSSREALEEILPDLYAHAATAFSAEDIFRFLGRKLHGTFAGESTTSKRRRPEGWRVRHTINRNSIKVYDKASVLRVETTINNPSEFKVLRVVKTAEGLSRRWCPMGKAVANTWRYHQVGASANRRYLTALAAAPRGGEGIAALDALCRPQIKNGRRHSRFNPLTDPDLALFQAVLAGEHSINGFRNGDLAARLYPDPPASEQEARQRRQRVCRLIAKLRGHGLIMKVKDARLYRVTPYGHRVLVAVIHVRYNRFPSAFLQAA